MTNTVLSMYPNRQHNVNFPAPLPGSVYAPASSLTSTGLSVSPCSSAQPFPGALLCTPAPQSNRSPPFSSTPTFISSRFSAFFWKFFADMSHFRTSKQPSKYPPHRQLQTPFSCWLHLTEGRRRYSERKKREPGKDSERKKE